MMKTNANDTRIATLRTEIEAKRTKLKDRSSRFVPKTNCSIELNGFRGNLNVMRRDELIVLGGQLQAIAAGSQQLSLPEPSLSGYSIADWLTDIKAKYDTLVVQEELAQLRQLDGKLQVLLSAEAQTDLAIREIEALLR